MERSYYNDEFEDLIKQKADQFRMYPSERVWKEVHKNLHPRKKWHLYGLALLLTSLGLYTANEISVPTKQASQQEPGSDRQQGRQNLETLARLIPFSSTGYEDITTPDPQIPLAKSPSASTWNSGINDSETNIASAQEPAKLVLMNPVSPSIAIPSSEYSGMPEEGESNFLSALEQPEGSEDYLQKLLLQIDPLPGLNPRAENSAPSAPVDEWKEADEKRVNWLQEYALYNLATPKTKRFSLQLFLSPTMSYRKLSGGKTASFASDIKNIPIALSIPGNVSKLVNHKPALGFELGGAIHYAANRKLSLKAGAQFNFSRYFIQAYRSSTEVATIALTDIYGLTGDSINSYSSLRNFGGYAAKDIQNQYYQLSAPVGAEWRVIGNKKLQFNIAGTIQPTYLLNRNTHLISTDYKNYTTEPSLVRRWNVNTAAEAYISYKTGGIRWQLGPQFRYQLLSTYSDEYPISEYLMEYGVKFGVTKTIR